MRIELYPCEAAEIAAEASVTQDWVRKLAPEMIEHGLAQRVGPIWRFRPEAADYIRNRPDGRGRSKKSAKA